jgi:hypothetical protein
MELYNEEQDLFTAAGPEVLKRSHQHQVPMQQVAPILIPADT